jgi:hypothetical protein
MTGFTDPLRCFTIFLHVFTLDLQKQESYSRSLRTKPGNKAPRVISFFGCFTLWAQGRFTNILTEGWKRRLSIVSFSERLKTLRLNFETEDTLLLVSVFQILNGISTSAIIKVMLKYSSLRFIRTPHSPHFWIRTKSAF